MTPAVTLPFVANPADGLKTPIGRLETIHKVPGYVTDGRVAIVEHTLPPKFISCPRHRHSREDELSIVLDGQLGAMLGDDVVSVATGAYLLKPRGQWHAVWNAGETTVRFIELLIPGGVEGYLDRMSELMAHQNGPSRHEVRRLAAEYGVEFDFDGIGKLCERFGLNFG